MATPGAERIVAQAVDRIRRCLGTSGHIEVHVHCRGGRHRSVAISEEIGDRLRAAGVPVQIVHKHITRPILPTSQS